MNGKLWRRPCQAALRASNNDWRRQRPLIQATVLTQMTWKRALMVATGQVMTGWFKMDLAVNMIPTCQHTKCHEQRISVIHHIEVLYNPNGPPESKGGSKQSPWEVGWSIVHSILCTRTYICRPASGASTTSHDFQIIRASPTKKQLRCFQRAVLWSK